MDGRQASRMFRLILSVYYRSQVRETLLIFYQVEESQGTGKISLGLSVIVRVTLRDGTYHEVSSVEYADV